jgi:hypothetical protein
MIYYFSRQKTGGQKTTAENKRNIHYFVNSKDAAVSLLFEN